MKFSDLRQDKGVAGLTILLSLITMIFVIGLLVMIYALMGGSLAGSSGVVDSESATTTQSNVALNDGAGTSLTACAGAVQGAGATFVGATNSSVAINSANFTFSGCTIYSVGTSIYNGTTISNVTYSYTYAGESYGVINETTTAISNVTDWFGIFIVISAMVVLILLVVIIISAVRGSGLMTGGSTATGNVGSA